MIGLAQIDMLYQIKYSSKYLRVELDYTRNQGDNILKIKFTILIISMVPISSIIGQNPSYPNKTEIWARHLVPAIDTGSKISEKITK